MHFYEQLSAKGGEVLGDTQVTATEFRTANSLVLGAADEGDPSGKGFHPQVVPSVGRAQFLSYIFLLQEAFGEKTGGLDVLGT